MANIRTAVDKGPPHSSWRPNRLSRTDSPEFDFVGAIAEHSDGFAAAADGNLDAAVEHCPSWTVTDLVEHLTAVQWFWATIAQEKLSSPPEDSRRPAAAPRQQLIKTFREGADRLETVLRAANGGDAVWTWAPAQQNIAFIARHQVQEAAVHHWDAVNAAGGRLAIAPVIAADSIAEFLTFSVSSDADPAEPARPALAGRFVLAANDIDSAWTVEDGGAPGTTRWEPGADPEAPIVTATASDLLLWLYQRVHLETAPVPPEVIARFRVLCFTD